MFVKRESNGLKVRTSPDLARATIVGIGTASPDHVWSQEDTLRTLGEHFPIYRNHRIEAMFANCGIDKRHFAIGPGEFSPKSNSADLHRIFLENAPLLAADAARSAARTSEIALEDIGQVVVATCTGYICPGLSVHLMRDLGLPANCQRADLVGMGCAGAMPAIQRAYDFVQNDPNKISLVVAVEVCSACWFVDNSIETVVGNAICGDGAAALLIRGGEHKTSPLPSILGFETRVRTDLLDAVGLKNVDGRQRIILSKEIRGAAGALVAQVVNELLARHGLEREEIAHWVFHAGGAAVLSNIEETLGFKKSELRASHHVLRHNGNISSPTTLFVLDRIQSHHRPQSGEYGIALALGPGLATEAALLRW